MNHAIFPFFKGLSCNIYYLKIIAIFRICFSLKKKKRICPKHFLLYDDYDQEPTNNATS